MPPLSPWVWLIALAQVAALLATASRYGYHRDELYFIVAGAHAAFGYPDQPPLVPLLCWAMHAIAPGSLLLLRTPSALASGATSVLAALIARELAGHAQEPAGQHEPAGGARAQVIAAACTACSAFALATGHTVSTTTFDMLSTTALAWLAVRAVLRSSGASVLAAGVVVGLGVEAKPQVGLVAAAMACALLALGPRAPLRSRWAAAGALAAVALAAPYLIWQQQHGFPQAIVAKHIAGNEEGGRAGFVPFQLLFVSPVLVPVWLAGLLAPYRRPRWRALRFITLTYLALALIYLAGNGKAYYLASLYPALLALGALPAAQWSARRARRTALLVAAVVLSGAVSAFIALPLLPQRDLQGSAVIALNPVQGETVGWPRFVRTVAAAWRSIPPSQRRHTAIFTANYGEAGAVDVLGPQLQLALPRAYSGHNGFSEWGLPPARDTGALLLGFEDAAEAAPHFMRCRTLARINDGVGLENQEQGLPVMLCRAARPWAAMWTQLRHYN